MYITKINRIPVLYHVMHEAKLGRGSLVTPVIRLTTRAMYRYTVFGSATAANMANGDAI